MIQDRWLEGAGAGPVRLLCGLEDNLAGAQAHSSGSRGLSGGWALTLSAHPADLVGLAPSGARWTCLQLDLQDVLLVYLNRCYGHLKSIRLCASLLVRNLYTSDLCFEPGEGRTCTPHSISHPCSQPWRGPSPGCLGKYSARAVLSLSSGQNPIPEAALGWGGGWAGGVAVPWRVPRVQVAKQPPLTWNNPAPCSHLWGPVGKAARDSYASGNGIPCAQGRELA